MPFMMMVENVKQYLRESPPEALDLKTRQMLAERVKGDIDRFEVGIGKLAQTQDGEPDRLGLATELRQARALLSTLRGLT